MGDFEDDEVQSAAKEALPVGVGGDFSGPSGTRVQKAKDAQAKEDENASEVGSNSTSKSTKKAVIPTFKCTYCGKNESMEFKVAGSNIAVDCRKGRDGLRNECKGQGEMDWYNLHRTNCTN